MLFRKQVFEARQKRLYGQVLIVTPIKFWVVTGFLCAIIAVLIVFLATASFARIETVRGAVVPTKGIVQVRAPSGGVLTDFTLTEGEAVTGGQVVGRITTSAAADGVGTRTGAELNRIVDHVSQIESRMEQSAAVLALDLAAKDRERRELTTQITNSVEMLDLQIEMLGEAEKNAARTSKLSARNLVNAEVVSQRNTGLIQARQDVHQMRSDIRILKIQRDNIALDQEQLRAKARLNQMEFEAEKARLLGESSIITGAQAFELIVPVTGTATAVLASDGYNLIPERQVFSILPENSGFVVELYVPSRAVGFIETGQDVRLLFDAFPYQRFGAQLGHIVEITSSVITQSGAELLIENTEPVYRVKVELADDTIKTGDDDHTLQAGMLLSANIVIEDRTILAWLLEPLLSVARRT